MLDMSDRFIKGFIAGVVGGFVHDILDIISNLIGIDELTYFGWAGIVIFGSNPNTTLEWVVAIFAKTLFTGILGVIFAYITPKITSKNYPIKGAFFGVTVWAISFSTVLLFKIEKLMTTEADSAASDAVTSIIYGIILALTYNWLDKRQKLIS